MVKYLTTKNIFKTHPLFYLTAFICVITANFKNFIIFSSIIIVHELGHIIGAIIFKWKIDKVILLPFGGITIFQENIDKSLKEEFIIAILGPLLQLVFYFLYSDNPTFNQYNLTILLFNLLPIYPLDGSKIVNILFNEFISFKRSHILTIITSFITLLVVILSVKYNLLLYLILLFIVLEIIKEINKHNYYFNRFLLERYLYNNEYSKNKIIDNIKKMKKQTKHIFKINNKYFTEREIIRNLFDK